MHEWGITKSVINEIIRQANENKIKNIDKVCLSVGEVDHLTPESFEFCFNVLRNETPLLSGTKLEIKKGDGPGVLINSIEGSK